MLGTNGQSIFFFVFFCRVTELLEGECGAQISIFVNKLGEGEIEKKRGILEKKQNENLIFQTKKNIYIYNSVFAHFQIYSIRFFFLKIKSGVFKFFGPKINFCTTFQSYSNHKTSRDRKFSKIRNILPEPVIIIPNLKFPRILNFPVLSRYQVSSIFLFLFSCPIVVCFSEFVKRKKFEKQHREVLEMMSVWNYRGLL